MSVFLDSDILIEVLRQRNDPIQAEWLALGSSGESLLYSPVSSAEIWQGARPHEQDRTNRLFRPLICVEINYAIGRLTGNFLQRFSKSHGLELPDALIAASAYQSRAQLWTRNRKHYPMPELSFYEIQS